MIQILIISYLFISKFCLGDEMCLKGPVQISCIQLQICSGTVRRDKDRKNWTAVVVCVVERSLLIPEVHSSNQVIGKNLYWTFSVNCIEKTKKEKEAVNGPFLNKILNATISRRLQQMIQSEVDLKGGIWYWSQFVQWINALWFLSWYVYSLPACLFLWRVVLFAALEML